MSGQCWEPVGFPVCTEFLLSVVFEVCLAISNHLLHYLLGHIAMQFTPGPLVRQVCQSFTTGLFTAVVVGALARQPFALPLSEDIPR